MKLRLALLALPALALVPSDDPERYLKPPELLLPLPAQALLPSTVAAQEFKERAVIKTGWMVSGPLAFSPDSETLMGVGLKAYDGWEVMAWGVATRKNAWTRGHRVLEWSALAYSPDGKTLAAVTPEGISLRDAATGTSRTTLKGEPSFISALAFSADGKRLAAAQSGTLVLWDLATEKPVTTLRRRASAYGRPALSPDLGTLAWPDFQDVDLWDVREGKVRRTLSDHQGMVSCVAFRGDGQLLAVAFDRSEEPDRYVSEVTLWDAATGKARATVGRGEGVVKDVRFGDGQRLVILRTSRLGERGELVLLDVEHDRVLATVRFGTSKALPQGIAVSPDGRLLAGACDGGTLRLWDVAPPKGK